MHITTFKTSTLSIAFLFVLGVSLIGCDSAGSSGADESDPGNNGDNSEAAPAAPSNLSGSAENGTVEISWEAVDADDLDGYNVYRATSSIDDLSGMDPQNDSPLSSTTYTDEDVESGTTYFYVATSVDEDGNESDPSEDVEVTSSSSGSEASGRIAFTQEDDIYTIGPGGSDRTSVLESDLEASAPEWSPDGSMMVFLAPSCPACDSFSIYTIQSDGSEQTQVTGSQSQGGYTWSPDGSKLAYQGDLGGGSTIYTIDPDGSDREDITDRSSESEFSPAWSPDGSQIAFIGDSGLASIKPDGTGRTKIDEEGQGNPTWAPDGSRIAYTADRNENPDIFTINPDGSERTRITEDTGSDTGPAWSPDGSRIVFSSDRSGNDRIYVVNADGSNLQQVTISSNDSVTDGGPIWSPDGTRIMFTRVKDFEGTVYTVNPDGTGLTEVHDGYASDWRSFDN